MYFFFFQFPCFVYDLLDVGNLISDFPAVAYQDPQSMGFFRQEYWSGLPFPSLGDLPDPGIEPGSPALKAGTLPSELPGKPKRLNQGATKRTLSRIWDRISKNCSYIKE